MRVDIVNITNDLAFEYGEKARAAGVDLFGEHGEVRVLDIYEAIFEHCKQTGTRPRSHSYGINNGMLTIDGANVKRVAGMINKPGYMRAGAFHTSGVDYEDLILRRQEATYE